MAPPLLPILDGNGCGHVLGGSQQGPWMERTVSGIHEWLFDENVSKTKG